MLLAFIFPKSESNSDEMNAIASEKRSRAETGEMAGLSFGWRRVSPWAECRTLLLTE